MGQLTNEERLRQSLADEARRAVPDDRDLWPTIARQARAVPPSRLGGRAPRMPPLVFRTVLATGVLLAVVLAAVIGLPAAYSLLNPPPPTVLPSVASGGSLSQTVGGYTLTIRPLHADANEVAISYTLTSPAGEAPNPTTDPFVDEQGKPGGPHLTSGDGSDLPTLPLPRSYSVNQTIVAPDAGQPLRFDASALSTLPPTLTLHLKMSLRPAPPSGFSLTNKAARPWPPVPTPTPGTALSPVVGPFSFDFQMPVDEARRSAKPNTVTYKNGITMTLSSVIVTASETRIVLSADSPAVTEIREWFPTISLESGTAADDRNGTQGTVRIRDQITLRPEGGWIYTHYGSLLNVGTDWALDVRSINSPTGSSFMAGPWVFHFTVPAPVQPTDSPDQGGAPGPRIFHFTGSALLK